MRRKITKQEAINGHRAMWRWIAEKIETEKKAVNLWEAQEEYCWIKRVELQFNDYCCEYDNDRNCEHCPINWSDLERWCGSRIEIANKIQDWKLQAEMAREFAELPENEEA